MIVNFSATVVELAAAPNQLCGGLPHPGQHCAAIVVVAAELLSDVQMCWQSVVVSILLRRWIVLPVQVPCFFCWVL